MTKKKNKAQLEKTEGEVEPLPREAKVRAYDAEVARVRGWTIVGGIGASGIPLYAMSLIANQVAGTSTSLNVNVALTAAVSMTGVAAAVSAYARIQKKRADRLETRNKDLERDVAELRDRLRENKLPTKTSTAGRHAKTRR